MRYKLNEDIVFSDITDGIAILILIEKGIYYGMNALSSNIYENLVNGVDSDELLDSLSKIKGFHDGIKNQFLDFINQFTSKEFLVEGNELTANPSLNFEEFNNDDLDFKLNEYPDAAELLLADPIHQVKEQIGWKPNKDILK